MKQVIIFLTFLISITASCAFAQSPITGLNSVKVIRGWRQADGTHMAAVHIKMEKGWKTYWRVAGGGGIPPQFDWKKSTNIRTAIPKWPAPYVYDDYGRQTIGFKDELVLPILLHPIDPDKPMRINGTIDFGICKDVCVPVRSALQADLPSRTSIGKKKIIKALKRQASEGAKSAINIINCNFTPIKGGFKISAKLTHPDSFSRKSIGIMEYPAGMNSWINQEASIVSGKSLIIQSTLYSKDKTFIDRSNLKTTVLTNNQAITFTGCGP